MAEVVLLTGAGSGLGLATATLLARNGYKVWGTALNEAESAAIIAAAGTQALRPVPMDVTRPESVHAAVHHVLDNEQRIDAVVQFAGLGLRGFFEDLTLEEIRRVYEVNVFGMMSVLQAVLPHMRLSGRGRLILTTSVAGRMGSMSIGGYASSKFAMEGLAECLALEVAPHGIHVSLLEPGLVATPHFTVGRNRGRRAQDPSSPYYNWFCQHEHIVDGILAKGNVTADDVAQQVLRILTAPNPKLRYVVGWRSKLVLALRRHLPGELFDRIYNPLLTRLVTRPKVQATGLSGAPKPE